MIFSRLKKPAEPAHRHRWKPQALSFFDRKRLLYKSTNRKEVMCMLCVFNKSWTFSATHLNGTCEIDRLTRCRILLSSCTLILPSWHSHQFQRQNFQLGHINFTYFCHYFAEKHNEIRSNVTRLSVFSVLLSKPLQRHSSFPAFKIHANDWPTSNTWHTTAMHDW